MTKHNFTAVAAPTVANDSASGYSQGSMWAIPSIGWLYECSDATVNAAVWNRVTSNYDVWQSGQYLYPANFGSGLSDATPAVADALWCFPFEITRQISSVAIALVTAGSAGAEAVCGLYPTDPTTGRPDGQARIGSSSTTVALDGTTGIKTMSLSRTGLLGLYWVGLQLKGVATMPVLKQMSNSNGKYVRGGSSFVTGGTPAKSYKYSPTYATSVPATMGGLSGDASSAPMPLIVAT